MNATPKPIPDKLKPLLTDDVLKFLYSSPNVTNTNTLKPFEDYLKLTEGTRAIYKTTTNDSEFFNAIVVENTFGLKKSGNGINGRIKIFYYRPIRKVYIKKRIEYQNRERLLQLPTPQNSSSSQQQSINNDSISPISSNVSHDQYIKDVLINLTDIQKKQEPVKKADYLDFPKIDVLIEEHDNKPILSFVGNQMKPLCYAIEKDLTDGHSDNELETTLKDAVGIQFKFYFEPQIVTQNEASMEIQKPKQQKQKQIKVDMDTDIPDGASGIINVKKSKDCTFITKAMKSLPDFQGTVIQQSTTSSQTLSSKQGNQQQSNIVSQQQRKKINPYDYKNLQGIQLIVFKRLRTATSTNSKQQ